MSVVFAATCFSSYGLNDGVIKERMLKTLPLDRKT